jgi:hypothetical protein
MRAPNEQFSRLITEFSSVLECARTHSRSNVVHFASAAVLYNL